MFIILKQVGYYLLFVDSLVEHIISSAMHGIEI